MKTMFQTVLQHFGKIEIFPLVFERSEKILLMIFSFSETLQICSHSTSTKLNIEKLFLQFTDIYILLPFFPVFSNWRDNKQNFLLCFAGAGAGAKKAIPRVTFIR